jgi:hypothetical protein
VGECVVVVVLVGRSLSARKVEEDADAQRFVEEEVAEELPVKIGASLGVRVTSVVCSFRIGSRVRRIINAGLASVPVKTMTL